MDKGYEIALKRIAECKRDHSTKLDLGSLGLVELPENIIELEWLEDLDLGNENFVQGLDFDVVRGNLFGFKKREHLAENKFSTIPFQISKLKNLKFLDLEAVGLETLNINDPSSLLRLRIPRNYIVDLMGIDWFENLVSLDASFNKINTISSIHSLKKIESLYLPGNKIADFGPISQFKNLKTLFVGANAITDLSLFSELNSLERLDVPRNNIAGNLTSLKKLKSLKYLNIRRNLITSLNGLEECTALESLYASTNQICEVGPLKHLKYLKYLYLEKNEIETFDILSNVS